MTIIEIWNKYQRIILISIGLVLLLFFIAFIFESCSNYSARKDLERLQQNANQLAANANAIQQEANATHTNLKIFQAGVNANLHILEKQAANQSVYLESLVNILNLSKNQREAAQTQTNKALANIERIENTDFTNTNLSEAEKARCKAFPTRCK